MSEQQQEADVLSVAELTAQIKGTLESTFPAVWVAGEISDLARPRSGHIYLTLKDAASQIRGVLWRSTVARLAFEPEDGQAVVAFGNVDVYAPRGAYQLVIRRLQPQGIGALELAFRQLREKLAAEGLFAAERKRALPPFPRRIGFVTSPTGAAIRDFLQVAARRWRGVEVVIIPARVQGAGAAREIAAGIAAATRLDPPLDALVVGRGGGSLEDLWCFNEEAVVRAIAACPLPTVSAVGHEIDVTLADLAADVRALTPTEAAERLLPSADQLKQILDGYAKRMARPLQIQTRHARHRLDSLAARTCFARPFELVSDRRRLLDELDLRLARAVAHRTDAARKQLAATAATLQALSPLAVLGRGYSVTSDAETGEVITRQQQTRPGQCIRTRVTDGEITSQIESVAPLEKENE